MKEEEPQQPKDWDNWSDDKQWGYLRGLANGRVQAAKDIARALKDRYFLDLPTERKTVTIAGQEFEIKDDAINDVSENETSNQAER